MSILTKKIVAIATALTCASMMVVPAGALKAQMSASELQAQINLLLEQLTLLQSQLSALEGGTPTVGAAYYFPGVPAGFTFQNNLKLGMSGDEVKYLQTVLNGDPGTQLAVSGVGSPGYETSYFGPLTQAAVKKFQEMFAAETLAPWGLTVGTGFVGSTTRAKLNEVLAYAGQVLPPVVEEEEEVPVGEEVVPAEGEEVITPAAGTGLTLALASDTPAAQVMSSGTAYNEVLKVNLTAGSDGDVKITGMTITKSGLILNVNIAGIAVFDKDGVRHGNFVTSLTADNTANLTFTANPITVPAGTTVPVTVKVNTGANATSGTMQFSIASAADITTTAAVSGSFPIKGNVMSLAQGANLGAVTVTLQTVGASTVDVGATGHLVTKFRFTEGNGYEDVKLSQIVLYNNGNADDDDFGNIVLTDAAGVTIATVESAVSKYITFNLDPAYTIPKGTSKDLSVKIDILGGANRTIDLRLMESYDLVMAGATSGYGILTSSTLPTASATNQVTINQGTVTVQKATTSPSGKIALGGKDVVLAKFDVKAFGEDYELRTFYYTVQRAVATNLAGTLKVTDSAGTILYSVGGASAEYGTTATAPAAVADWTQITLSGYKTIKAGTTETLTFTADISSSATTADNYQVHVTEFYGKRLSTLDYYTAVDAGALLSDVTRYGNTLTVDTAILRVAKNDSFANPAIVGGKTVAKIASFVLQATDVEDVNVTSMVLTCATMAQGYINLQLKVGDTNFGSAIATPTLTTGTKANTISGALTIPKGSQKVIDVYVDTASNTTTGTSVTLGSISATGANSGADVTKSPTTAVTGQAVTISAGGALAIEADSTNTPVRQLLTAATLSAPVLKFKVTADSVEDLTINKLYLGVNELTGPGVTSSGNVSNVTLKKGTTILGVAQNPVSGQVAFSGLGLSVPKGTSVQLTVEADVTGSGVLVPGAKVFAGPVYTEYTRTAGVVTQYGGVYNSYTATTGVFTVYNISQFANSVTAAPVAVRVDINGDGDFADNTNNVNEATTYYVCAISGSTLTLRDNVNCAGNLVAPTALSDVDGWVAPAAVASNRMLIHDAEPVISLAASSLSGTQGGQAGQDIAKFDVKADGQRPLLVRAISWTTSGSYVAPTAHTGTITTGNSHSVTATAKTGFADTYTITITGSADNARTFTITNAAGTTLETHTVDTTTAANVITTLTAASKYVGFTTSNFVNTDGIGNQAVTLSAAANNGGIYDWKVQINDVDQAGTLYAQYGTTADDSFYLVSASTLRTISATNLTFIFTTPVEISAGSTATFEINANTSAVKAGLTSGTITAGVSINGTKGEGQWLGGNAGRGSYTTTAGLGGLRWDYTTVSGVTTIYGATGTATAGTMTVVAPAAAVAGYIDASATTTLDPSDSYIINGNTITY